MLRRLFCVLCALALLLCAPALAETDCIVEGEDAPAGEAAGADAEWEEIIPLNCAPKHYLAYTYDGGAAWQLLDENKKVIDPDYLDWVQEFSNGYAVVRRDGLYGMIDEAGTFVLPVEYDSITDVRADGTCTAVSDSPRPERLGGAADVAEGVYHVFIMTEDGPRETEQVGSDLSLEDYMPFTGSKVAKLDGKPTLTKRASYDYRHPRLDGATALFPVYAAFVEAVYPDETRYSDAEDAVVTCTKTNRAYERLIEGGADIIFCAGPSDAQIAAAAEVGVEFELTPFGREAFVFIVNQENPLDSISVSQVREIYSGEITRWDELWVPNLGEIAAYQRPENSGSQTALERLMGDTPIAAAPSEYIPDFMDGIVNIIEYRNLPNAIGYSFRFFCTEMMNSGVKLLSLDGVAPTVENIRDGSYPQITTLYAISRKGETNANVRALLDWITSEQGQELVEKSGYVAY